jgi:hypothetical protein
MPAATMGGVFGESLPPAPTSNWETLAPKAFET